MQTVELKIHDNRICWRCGAKQGKCEHTEGKVYEGVLRTKNGLSEARQTTHFSSWYRDEIETIKHLIASNYTYSEIAERLNLSRGAIAGKVHRLKQSGEIPA